MPNIFPFISAILCFTLLIPTVSADEVSDIPVDTTAVYEVLEEPESTEVPETLPPETGEEPTEPPVTVPETWAETESPTEPETEPTETIPMVTEVTIETDEEDTLSLILTSQQNTEYATQLIAGFGLFFTVCIICYFSYKFFRIFF